MMRAVSEPRREIVLASQNQGKVDEMRGLLAKLPWQVLGLRDLGIEEAPEETGATFRENALQKGRFYAARTGRMVVADDSGLSVDALGGGPGVYTSRFGGPGLSDGQRNELLLTKLRGIPTRERGARFTCALAVVEGGALLLEVQETCEGRIAEEPSGEQGFGYDPVFYFPAFGSTLACVPPEEKARVSHRGKAFAHLVSFLAARGRVSPGAAS
jgi:XTP/dITP diphosphohydrolase